MHTTSGSKTIEQWPDDTRDPARLVIDKYGEPDESTQSMLIWHNVGPWKRIVASRTSYHHEFPMPHEDSVESFIDCRVPPEKFTELAQFDGSVIVERTAGEVPVRCHDEQANFLALNLMHDIVTGAKTVQQARRAYADAVLDYRRKRPTPYMEKLHFASGGAGSADQDARLISDDEQKRAAAEGTRA